MEEQRKNGYLKNARIADLWVMKEELEDTSRFLQALKQHEKLGIRISSPARGALPREIADAYRRPHRKTNYFFHFMIRGQAVHSVDMQDIPVGDGQLLFITPYQIHRLPDRLQPSADNDFFKIVIDQECLSLLPRPFPFLVAPFQSQLICFDPAGIRRVKSLFELLAGLLEHMDAPPELILAHLTSLLTECNHAYFRQVPEEGSLNGQLSLFIRFKELIESQLTTQPAVTDMAAALAINTNQLYHLVKQYAGISPKTYLTNRLILEAQRQLYYSNTSIKELAFELGFNDPEYFSRLFRKVTGRSIDAFLRSLH